MINRVSYYQVGRMYEMHNNTNNSESHNTTKSSHKNDSKKHLQSSNESRKYSELEDSALDQAIKTLTRLAHNRESKPHLRIVTK